MISFSSFQQLKNFLKSAGNKDKATYYVDSNEDAGSIPHLKACFMWHWNIRHVFLPS